MERSYQLIDNGTQPSIKSICAFLFRNVLFCPLIIAKLKGNLYRIDSRLAFQVLLVNFLSLLKNSHGNEELSLLSIWLRWPHHMGTVAHDKGKAPPWVLLILLLSGEDSNWQGFFQNRCPFAIPETFYSLERRSEILSLVSRCELTAPDARVDLLN